MSGRSGHYYDAIREALKEAGWELHRHNNGHDIYRRGDQSLAVPRKLDDIKKYREILRQGVTNG